MGYESPSPLGSQCSSRPAAGEYLLLWQRCSVVSVKLKGLDSSLRSPILAASSA